MISGRRRSVIFFTVLGICLVALAVTLNVSWIVLNWDRALLAVLGLIFFLLIIAGMVLNTIFLVREIRRNEQHDSFINAVTHELKTPVASIRLYLQTLQTRELDEARRREFYRIMLEDSDRLLHTIEQVLRAGSVASWPRLGRRVRTRINLAELVRESVELARTRFRLDPEALSYVQHVDDQRSFVSGDVEELKTAVWNLIDNAIKYSPNDPRIRVLIEDGDDYRLAVRVLDNGVGISPGELKRVFRRFYRVPTSVAGRSRGSSGLGLFIVRSVARRHGGKAFAHSEGAGRGSTFTLLLPRATQA
jgi:two-component system, OmpR family, sensor histidine kinase SenX3